MKKIWFLDINGHLKGPYSVKDLKNDKRVTPDSLVWKEGFAHSVPIRNVPELKEIFTDKEPRHGGAPERMGPKQLNDLMIMEMSQEPPFLMWVMILLILFLLAWYLHRV